MTTKRTDRDLVRRALWDAIDWQESLAEAQGDDEWGDKARELAKQYKSLLRRRYGERQSPIDKALEGATMITLEELRARTK